MKMELSMTTDYAEDTGDPFPYLKRIANTGFSHVHWGHHWNTDYFYSPWEIERIRERLKDYGLKLLDLHGSIGPEKNWASPREYQRRAGVELVRNRIEMTSKLGGEVIIMHAPIDLKSKALHKSLNELESFAGAQKIRIAMENTGNFDVIARLLSQYSADYLGLCYDSGHGNISGMGVKYLEMLKGRLISVHLHDNFGSTDQHMLPFSGRIGWARLARVIAESAYTKPVSMEISMRGTMIKDEELFLKKAFDAGIRLSRMIIEERKRIDSQGPRKHGI